MGMAAGNSIQVLIITGQLSVEHDPKRGLA
jgi:hypothetical protein